MLTMARALLSVAILLAICSSYVSGVPLPRIREISSTSTKWNLTLSVEVHRHVSSQVNFTSRQYCYEGVCSMPGPVLRVKPGDTVTLTLQNKLARYPVGAEHHHNHFHSPNETNIHTHGLHVSANEDQVIEPVYGGEQKVYTYNIYDKHAPGTHWYHSHLHGASALHMAGGMVGALIMEPNSAATLPAALTNTGSSIVVLTAHKFNPQRVPYGNTTILAQGCLCDTDGYECKSLVPQHTESYPQLTNHTGSLVADEADFADPSVQELILANGEFAPTIELKRNEQHILRVVHANGFYSLDMRVPGCTLDVIAADGVYYTAFRRAEFVSFTSGCRYDVLVQCAAAGTYRVESQYGQPFERINQTILVLEVSSDAATPAQQALTSSALATITRPDYLQSLANATVVDSLDVSFTQTPLYLVIGDQCGLWMGTGPDCSNITMHTDDTATNLNCRFQQFPGAQGGDGTALNPPPRTQQYHHVTGVGRVNEWRVYSWDDHWHPFHLHVYHFQIVGYEPNSAASDRDHFENYFSIGEWRDTIPVLPGRVIVRFKPLHFAGETVMHCHWLSHEDLGMMATVYVCDESTGGVPGSGSCPAANIAHAAPAEVQGGTGEDRFAWSSVGGVFAIIAMVLAVLALVALCTICFVRAVRNESIVKTAPAGTQMAAVPPQVAVHA